MTRITRQTITGLAGARKRVAVPAQRRFLAMAMCLSLMFGGSMLPVTAMAIPIAGDYSLSSDFGVSGTFTSDGAMLTAWDFTSSLYGSWDSSATPVNNDVDDFVAGYNSTEFAVWLQWLGPSTSLIGNGAILKVSSGSQVSGAVRFTAIDASQDNGGTVVPEPASLLLFAVGLLILGGSLTRKRGRKGEWHY